MAVKIAPRIDACTGEHPERAPESFGQAAQEGIVEKVADGFVELYRVTCCFLKHGTEVGGAFGE